MRLPRSPTVPYLVSVLYFPLAPLFRLGSGAIDSRPLAEGLSELLTHPQTTTSYPQTKFPEPTMTRYPQTMFSTLLLNEPGKHPYVFLSDDNISSTTLLLDEPGKHPYVFLPDDNMSSIFRDNNLPLVGTPFVSFTSTLPQLETVCCHQVVRCYFPTLML